MKKDKSFLLSDTVIPITSKELIEVRKYELEEFILPNRQTIIPVRSRSGVTTVVVKSRILDTDYHKKKKGDRKHGKS